MYFEDFSILSIPSWNHFFKGTSANHKVAISPLQGVSELAAQGHKPDERGLPNQSRRRAEHLRISALPILRNFSLSDLQLATFQNHLRIKKSSKNFFIELECNFEPFRCVKK